MVASRYCFDQTLRGNTMARCETCGKTTMFGNSRSHSMKITKRKFKPNLHTVRVFEGGRLVRKTLCARCIKALAKT